MATTKGKNGKDLPVPPEKKLEHESGSIKAIGDGVSKVNLDFRPSKVDFEIIEEIPGSPSCNPTVKPIVKISQFPHKKNWVIRFEWDHLAGVNYINWQASE